MRSTLPPFARDGPPPGRDNISLILVGSQYNIGAEEKRRAVAEVLGSSTFARADQLRRFLRYICEMEMAGRAAEISEYSIATEALGRSAAYTPGDDSSVRSRAHALRQKLQEFYETEHPAAPVRIELRKGGYIPVFQERGESSKVEEPSPRRGSRGWLRPFAAGATAATVLSLLLLAATRHPGSAALDPVLREAWGGMLSPNAAVVVCLGSPPALLLKSYKNGNVPNSPHILPAPGEIGAWYAGLHEQDGGGPLFTQPTMNTVLSGDALAAVRAVRLLSTAGAAIQVLPEWGLRPLALRGRNVLLIGSPNYSPYAARILRNTPFTVRYDPATREEVISDGPPEAPGTHVFRPKRDQYGELTQVYGLLTVVPSQASSEGREQTIIFSGITSAGPQSAMEFLASPVSLRVLRDQLAREGYPHFPPAYQVVVRCGVDRALALNWAYETHRVIQRPPPLD